MVWIYTEDTTSGFDFISAVVKVLRPSVSYRVQALNGAYNCNKFLTTINNAMYKSGDVLILYFDVDTLNLKALYNARSVLDSSIRMYIQNYTCFESVLFSFNIFDNVINLKDKACMFSDFRYYLSGIITQRMFIDRYSNILGLSTNTRYTEETLANIVFSVATSDMKCLHVNKHKYKAMDYCSRKNLIDLFFYTDRCNMLSTTDKVRMDNGKYSYCIGKHIDGTCRFIGGHSLCQSNMLYFYEHSLLSSGLRVVNSGNTHITNTTLKDILRG